MIDTLAANWPLVAIGAVIALIVLWWVILTTRKTRVIVDRRDTLDEGASRAARNQALIEAPAAAIPHDEPPLPPAVPEAIGGAGIAVAAAVEEAQLSSPAGSTDDLTQIKGLGPKLATTLQEMGITTLAQIAAWNDADIDRVDGQLGRFEGRIRRDQWVEQAKLLAAGNGDAFAAKFGAQ